MQLLRLGPDTEFQKDKLFQSRWLPETISIKRQMRRNAGSNPGAVEAIKIKARKKVPFCAAQYQSESV